MKNIKLLFLFLIANTILKGQVSTSTDTPLPLISTVVSPKGLMDTVFDNYGNRYSLNDITVGKSSNTNGAQSPAAVLLCTSGYFNLYFEVGSGMEGNSVTETDRRNVICQVFSDISAFINSPLTNLGNTNRVNIIVKDINPLLAGYNAGTNPNPSATSNVLGLATGFYNMPYNTTPGFGGIADNEIWKTIHAGTDSYQGVASPPSSTAGPGGTYFHGLVAFNFGNAGVNWNITPSAPTYPSNLFDLYSVVLHEVTHALGFTSLIDYTGASKFGTGFNYYSRYDLFLKNSNASQYLIGNTGACSLYNFQFNPSPSILTPGCTANPPTSGSSSDNTPCGTAIRYVGATNVPVYTPSCFEATSSLGHFEDECYPTATSPLGNNIYFTMSNANGAGVTKRSLTPEERLVLCDLGYSTKNTFGTITNHNDVTYASPVCPGLNVGGINDGINLTNGNYLYIGNVGTGITIAGINNNDFPANSTYECLDRVFGTGTLPAATSGSGSFIYTPTSPGVHLLRYVPVSPTGERGNITYIYVYATTGVNCNPNTCNLIPNGDFEQQSGFPSTYAQLNLTCGWLDATNSGGNGAEYYHSSATSSLFDVPCNLFGYELDRLGRNAYVGMISTGSNLSEKIYTSLSSPLTPLTSYQLKVDYSLAEAVSSEVVPMQVYLSTTPPIVANSGPIPITNPLMLFSSGTNITQTNGWRTLTFNFTTGTTSGEQYIALGNIQNIALTATTHAGSGLFGCNYTSGTNNGYVYYYVDNVSLTPIANLATFTPPSVLCLGTNQIITLDNYVSIPNGTFSGPGVSCSGGACTFDPNAVGAGNYSIDYTYTNGNGCTYTVSATITVVNANINVTASASPNTVCSSGAVTLTGGGATSYEWQPGTISGSPIVVNPTASTTYVVTGTDANGCKATASVAVTVTPLNINLTANQNPLCIGQPLTLTPTGALSYDLQPGNMTGGGPFVITPPPSVTTIYDVVGTDANGCTGTAQITVAVQNCNPCTNCPNALAPTGVLSTNPPANQVYCLTNNMTISGNITISQSEVKISPNVVITVPANSVLNIVGSHLYSCTDMWQGIVIEPKGSINILPYIVGNTTQKTSLIEDAEIAVDVQPSNGLTTNILTSDNATFNKNHYGIRIQGYTPNLVPYPFTVINSLFTCRNIPFTSNANTWPLTSTVKAATNPITSPLQTPYINNTTYSPSNANAFLKTPLAGQKSQTAIYLNKVGNTINPGTTPTYYEISIGTTGANNYNVFDNHLVALYGLNTNVKVANSVFQNAITTGKAGTVGGIGIQVLSQEINNNRLQVVGANPAGIFFNKFFNCSRSILSQDYFENIIKNNDFRSTQVASALFQPGKYGITITSCRYRAVTVTSNKLYNIENPIAFSASVGFFNVGSGGINGQYSGQVDINTNTIRQHLAGNTITSQFVNLGIAISNIVSISNLVLIPGKTVNANSNTIDGAYRGIGSANWFKKDVSTNNNTIRLVFQVATGTPLQYGIGSSNNTPASQNNINGNVITGFNTTYNRLHGIYTSLSTGQTVNCNSTTNTYNGLTFNGNSAPTKTAYNTMGNHHYGFVLDNNGIIGQQGTPTAPCDNTYTGPFVFKTAVLNTSSPSSAVSSPMYVRGGIGVTNPNGSSLVQFPGNAFVDDYFNNGTASSTLKYVGGNPPFIGCSTNNGNGNGNNPTNPISNRLILEKIVQDQLPLIANPSQTEKINKHQVYRLLKSNPDLMTGSTVLQDFYTNSQPTLRETFVSIETDLSQGDITTGANKVAFIAPQDNIETNYKNFYEAYIKQSTDSLNATDSLQLATIASGCPFTDGAVVYQARALYNVVYNSAVTFEDNCPTIAANSRLGKEQNNTVVIDKDGFDALVYPNPSNGNIFVAPIGKDVENIVITVTDITGKVLYNEQTAVTTNFVNFNLNVKAGTYFVTIANTYTNEKIIKKLMIQ